MNDQWISPLVIPIADPLAREAPGPSGAGVTSAVKAQRLKREMSHSDTLYIFMYTYMPVFRYLLYLSISYMYIYIYMIYIYIYMMYIYI